MLSIHTDPPFESSSSRPDPHTPVFLTRRQVATYLNMSEKWLAQAGRSHGPAFYKFGGRCRYRIDDVISWARQQRSVVA